MKLSVVLVLWFIYLSRLITWQEMRLVAIVYARILVGNLRQTSNFHLELSASGPFQHGTTDPPFSFLY